MLEFNFFCVFVLSQSSSNKRPRLIRYKKIFRSYCYVLGKLGVVFRFTFGGSEYVEIH